MFGMHFRCSKLCAARVSSAQHDNYIFRPFPPGLVYTTASGAHQGAHEMTHTHEQKHLYIHQTKTNGDDLCVPNAQQFHLKMGALVAGSSELFGFLL